MRWCCRERKIKELIKEAMEARKNAYTPGNCAERTAIFKAVSEGVKEFQAICVVGGRDGGKRKFEAI